MTDTLHDDCACNEYNELTSRRDFLARSGVAGAAMFAISQPEWMPQFSFADSAQANRDILVSVFLRGGADGLTLCVPWGDDLYYTGRSTIAVPRPDSSNTAQRGINLDGFFALPQGMRFLKDAYDAKHLLIAHGAGLTYRTRSHFDAQRFMEVGKAADVTVKTGWLARHLATSSPIKNAASLRAIGFSDGLVDTLKGAPKSLPISDPANYGIAGTTATRDARTQWLLNDFQQSIQPAKAAAEDAINTINLLRSINVAGYQPGNGAVYPNTGLARGLRSTAALIKADIGLEAAHLDIGGWDTHTNQNPLVGGMFNTMTQLSQALGAFWQDCIASGLQQNVTVVVMSEFGRNVRENGSRGTDHGRGTAMFVMGRNIDGGRVMTKNWLPLDRANLADNQDLPVTIDHRDILAEVVLNRLGNTNLSTVFPGYTPTMLGMTK